MKFLKSEGAYLLVAASVQLFAGGKWNYFLAPWLSLSLFLCFVRRQSKITAVWAGYLPYVVVTGCSMYGVVPLPLPLYVPFILVMTLLLYGGFHFDRWAVRRCGSHWSLVAYPTYVVTLEGLVSLGPYGTWNSLSYTQEGNLPLIQVVSITGIWGVTFIIALTASVVAKVCMEGFRRAYLMRLLLPVGVMLVVVHVWGVLRMGEYTVTETVTVGTCNTSEPGIRTLQRVVTNYVQRGSPAEEVSDYRSASREGQRQLLQKARDAAGRGARIIFWPEANALVFEDDERAFTDRLSRIAEEKGVFILAPLAVVHYGESLMSNQVVMISPDPERRSTYIKSIIPPGEPSIKGDGELKVVDSPWGTLSGAICFDLDFPGLIRQAGKSGASVLIVPALDWDEIAYIHAVMAKYRAIENGCNLVRYAEGGFQSVVTPVGRTLYLERYEATSKQVNVVEVPTNRLATLYPFTGDWFLYGAIAGMIVLAVYCFRL